MPIKQGNGQSEERSINLEGIKIDLDKSNLRHILAGMAQGLNAIIPGLGVLVGGIVELIGIKGRTQHLGVEDGYRVAREIADNVGLQVREQFKPSRPETLPVRVALTRRLARTSYNFFLSRYPQGLARDTVQRIFTYTASTGDEIYTVFYLSAYVIARNADVEHWQEEVTNFLRDVLLADVERFASTISAEQGGTLEETEKQSASIAGGLAVLLPVTWLAKKFFFK
jgi:hypothetical protein